MHPLQVPNAPAYPPWLLRDTVTQRNSPSILHTGQVFTLNLPVLVSNGLTGQSDQLIGSQGITESSEGHLPFQSMEGSGAGLSASPALQEGLVLGHLLLCKGPTRRRTSASETAWTPETDSLGSPVSSAPYLLCDLGRVTSSL